MPNLLKTITENRENLLGLNYKKSLDSYVFIQREFEKGSIVDNSDFKRVYENFYRLTMAGLTPEWKEAYFKTLDSRETNLEKILNHLYEIPNRKGQNSIQFSFATKLIHTIDNTKPIFDSFIGKMVGQKPKGKTKEDKMQSCGKVYDVLQEVFASALKDDALLRILEEFRGKFGLSGERNISDEKIFDFLLWGLGKLKENKNIYNY